MDFNKDSPYSYEDENIEQRLRRLDEHIPVPHSVSAQRMLEKLALQPSAPLRPAFGMKRIAAAAAAIVMVLASVTFLARMQRMNDFAVQESADIAVKLSAVDKFYAKDYSEVKDAIEEVQKRNRVSLRSKIFNFATGGMGGGDGGVTGSAAPEAGNDFAISESAPQADMDARYSTTNVQVQGIDEADIVKTDGSYIYAYSSYYDNMQSKAVQAIHIVNAADLTLAGKIELPQELGWSMQMYVDGDRLALVGNSDKTLRTLPAGDGEVGIMAKDIAPGFYPYASVSCLVYDISDRTSPKKLRTFEQEGSYISSRYQDGFVYLVSRHQIVQDIGETPDDPQPFVPLIRDSGAGSVSTPVAARSIAILPKITATNYAVVSAISLEGADSAAQTKAVLGGAQEIYMSPQSLYLVYSQYTAGKGDTLGVVKLGVDGENIEVIANGQVPGRIDSQFSMDEFGGNFRVATTSQGNDSESANNVYVLDSTLSQIGAVENLAPGERIYSVRFMGEMAYVVTFKSVDPLFAIDLSDPAKPKVLGELKIPGFSEYLHPLDEDTLIGLGYSTKIYPDGRVTTSGMKLSLFDLSDKTNPVERDVYYIGNEGSRSEALYNHKAFLFDAQRGMLAFPATVYSFEGEEKRDPFSSKRAGFAFNGLMLFTVDKDEGFTFAGSVTHGTDSTPEYEYYDGGLEIQRCVYIGERLYTVSGSEIRAHSYPQLEPLGSLKLR